MCSILSSRFSQVTCKTQNFRRISRKPLARMQKLVMTLASPLQVRRSSWGKTQAFCKSANTFRDVCKPLVFRPVPFQQVRKPLARLPDFLVTFASPLHVRLHSLAHHPTLISKNPMEKLVKIFGIYSHNDHFSAKFTSFLALFYQKWLLLEEICVLLQSESGRNPVSMMH